MPPGGAGRSATAARGRAGGGGGGPQAPACPALVWSGLGVGGRWPVMAKGAAEQVPPAAPCVAGGEDAAGVREWAKQQAADFPPWSNGQWRRICAGLGYRLDDPPPDERG